MPTDATVAQQAAPHSTTAAWLAIPAVLHVDPSPDGRRIAVTTTQIPLGTHDELSNIQIVTVANGSSHPLDAAWPGDHTATWSPDGTRLAFVTARTGRPQLAVCDTTSSEPIAISNLPGGVTGPASWSPDGTTLVVAGPRGRLVRRRRETPQVSAERLARARRMRWKALLMRASRSLASVMNSPGTPMPDSRSG